MLAHFAVSSNVPVWNGLLADTKLGWIKKILKSQWINTTQVGFSLRLHVRCGLTEGALFTVVAQEWLHLEMTFPGKEKADPKTPLEKWHIFFLLTVHWPKQVRWHDRLQPGGQEVHPSQRDGRRIGIFVNDPKASHCGHHCVNWKHNWKGEGGATSWSFVCKTNNFYFYVSVDCLFILIG